MPIARIRVLQGRYDEQRLGHVSKAVRDALIETFGNPAEVVKAVNVPDVSPPASGEVVIARDRLAPLIAADTISVPVVATYGVDQFKEPSPTRYGAVAR